MPLATADDPRVAPTKSTNPLHEIAHTPCPDPFEVMKNLRHQFSQILLDMCRSSAKIGEENEYVESSLSKLNKIA